jgi:hypothetical protein
MTANVTQRKPDKMWERNKIKLRLLCCGGCRGEEKLQINFKLEMFYSGG